MPELPAHPPLASQAPQQVFPVFPPRDRILPPTEISGYPKKIEADTDWRRACVTLTIVQEEAVRRTATLACTLRPAPVDFRYSDVHPVSTFRKTGEQHYIAIFGCGCEMRF
jgi:hypothetical protein